LSQRKRLDTVLVERGEFATRNAARGAVIRGEVIVDDRRELKPGRRIPETAAIHVMSSPPVGRGALKMERALEVFGLDVTGTVAMDVGASTGGFTETLLHYGAAHVYAIDVGRNQLHPDLREDPRVTNMEGTDIRRLDAGLLDDPIGLATVDVSFISLSKILPSLGTLLSPETPVIMLVKPQFEAGASRVGGGGVVRSRETHREILMKTADAVQDLGFVPASLTHSPVLDPDSNLEFFLLAYVRRAPQGNRFYLPSESVSDMIDQVVADAWSEKQGWTTRWEKKASDADIVGGTDRCPAKDEEGCNASSTEGRT